MTYLTQEQALDKPLIRYLAEQVVAEPIHSIKKLGGACAWNYDVNGHIILKLPRANSFIQDWKNQSIIAPIIQKKLSVKIPQLQTKDFFLSSTSEQALTSVQYEKIQGVCIHPNDFPTMSPEFKEKYFDQLSEIMLQLHSIPLEVLPVEFMTKLEYIQRYFKKKLGKHHSPFVEKTLNDLIFNRFFGFKKENIKNDILCHGDLHPGNVCLDNNGNILGILDFESLTRGEPVLEFRPTLYGKKDLRLLLKTYLKKAPHPFDLKDVKRVKHIKDAIIFFCILYKLYHSGVNKTKALQNFLLKNQKI